MRQPASYVLEVIRIVEAPSRARHRDEAKSAKPSVSS